MCTSAFFVCLLLIKTAFGYDETQAKLRFYHNTMDNYTEMYIDEAENIISTSWYQPDRKTVVFCHGFAGHPNGPAIRHLMTTYLSKDEFNVALLNWDKLAAIALPGLINSYINWALPNSIQLAGNFSKCLLRMSAAGFNLNNTHFVGHSLGAHILGIAGNKMSEQGVQLPWITGLDPAIGFDMKPSMLRLRPQSARFVVVLHSDPYRYGTRKEMGTVDFWPNFKPVGPSWQPGCATNAMSFSDEEFCSHNRAWVYLGETITNPGSILGSHAKNFRMWKKYNEKQRRAIVLELGTYSEHVVPGNYYFTTAAQSPYGLGENGL